MTTVIQSEEQIMAAKAEQVALVTGASSGIGAAAARELAGAGFTVYGTSRTGAAGEERDGVAFLPLGVTNDESEPTAGLRAGTARLRRHPGGGDEDRGRPRRDRQGDRRGGNRPETEAALPRRLGGWPHQHAPPPCACPDLRPADPQDQSTQRSGP